MDYPSSFVDGAGVQDGSLRLFLSYSANFDLKPPVPPLPAGSGFLALEAPLRQLWHEDRHGSTVVPTSLSHLG